MNSINNMKDAIKLFANVKKIFKYISYNIRKYIIKLKVCCYTSYSKKRAKLLQMNLLCSFSWVY